MPEQLQKIDMVVGKEYKGYAWRNEYGEFFFRPAAEGSRAGRVNKIFEESEYSISHTKSNVLIHIRIPKTNDGTVGYIKMLSKIVDKLIEVFIKYDI